MKNLFQNRIKIISIFFILILELFLPEIGFTEDYMRIKVVIGVNSSISSGINSIEQIAKLAKESSVKAVILTDHALAKGEYGLWPFRRLLRKVVERESILKFGARRYIDLVDRINRENRDILIIPACDVAPFYWWQGSPFKGNLTVNDWSKQLIVIGLKEEKDYQNLPLLSNDYRSPHYGLKSILRIWPIIFLILGIILFRKRRFNYIDDFGRNLGKISVFNRTLGAIIIIIGVLVLLNNFPFNILDEFDPYKGDPGILPYQRLIDYVNSCGAMTFWSSLESNIQNKIGRISFSTFPHKEDLFKSSGFTGFSVIYGDRHTVHQPGREWDRLLHAYCLGERENAVWGIAETGYQGPPEKIDYIHNVFFVRELSKEEILNSLRKGRFYAVWRYDENEVNLENFSISDVLTGNTGYMGDEILVKDRVNIYIKGYQSTPDPQELKIRLVRNGEVIETLITKEKIFTYEIFDKIPEERKKSYYRLIIDGRVELVSNPIFVKRE